MSDTKKESIDDFVPNQEGFDEDDGADKKSNLSVDLDELEIRESESSNLKLQKRMSLVEKTTISKAILKAKEQANSYKERGLSPVTFFVGLMNLMASSFILGNSPENYWIFMTLKCWFYLGLKWHEHIQKPVYILFMVEYCWISCHALMFFMSSGCLAALGLVANPLTNSRYAFHAFWCMANGPFAISVVLLGNALVLHDLPNLSSAFIHLSPCSLAWTLRWYAPRIMKRWPGIFDLPPLEDDANFSQITIPALQFYMFWWFVYLLYNFFVGRNYGIPDSKIDSQTMYTFRTNPVAAKICGWKKDTYEQRHAFKPILIHMIMHAFFTCSIISFSYVMYHSFWVHTAWCLFILGTCAYNGSLRYYNMMTKYFVKSLEKIERSEHTEDKTHENKKDN